VQATWDIHSNNCALTMSSTHIFSSLSTERARFSALLISHLFRTDIPSSQHSHWCATLAFEGDRALDETVSPPGNLLSVLEESE
jgi:hypothetical protein